MLSFVSDQDVVLVVPFLWNDEPFIPDASSATWSLRDAAGVLVGGYTDVALVTTGVTKISITVPAAENALAGRFEKRTVVVKALRNGYPWSVSVPYKIHPWLNHTVSPEDVRNFIGVGMSELPDSSIDLLGAYVRLEATLTQSVLNDALTAGGSEEQVANNAVLGHAVLLLLPALRQRLLLKKADGPLRADRDTLDFSALAGTAQAYIADAVSILLGVQDSFADAFITFSEPTDPITGE